MPCVQENTTEGTTRRPDWTWVTAAACAKAVALGQTTSAAEAPQRPALQEVSKFMLLEREVELEGHVDRSQLAAA